MDREYAQYLRQKTKDDYNKIASHFNETRNYPWPDFEVFKNYYDTGDTVLDIGCGNGRLSEIFKEIKVNYTGLDTSERMIAAARVKYPEEKFIVGDLLDLPFAEGSFDEIFLIAVMQHIPGREWRLKALDNIHWALKKGGYLLMTNWNMWQKQFRLARYKYKFMKLLGRNEMDFNDILKPWRSPEGETITERYLHIFTPPEIEGLFKETRFKLLKNYYSYKGQPATRSKGFNIVTIAEKV